MATQAHDTVILNGEEFVLLPNATTEVHPEVEANAEPAAAAAKPHPKKPFCKEGKECEIFQNALKLVKLHFGEKKDGKAGINLEEIPNMKHLTEELHPFSICMYGKKCRIEDEIHKFAYRHDYTACQKAPEILKTVRSKNHAK